MSLRVSVISASTEYDLSDGVNYKLLGIDGIGAAPVMRFGEQGAMQHGESDRGYRLRARQIVLGLLVRGGSLTEWFSRRDEIVRIFRPTDDPIYLRISDGDEIIRQIDCHYRGMMEMKPEAMKPGWQKVGIELYAPDPTFYDPDGRTNVFALGGGSDLMEIPLAVPWKVGASELELDVAIDYLGSWDAYPIITITGPITDLVIENTSLGDKLDFSGVTIGAGVNYVIDCRYGYKTVMRSSDGANRIQDLTADSNLATFRIGAHPQPIGGDNGFHISGTGLTTASKVVMQYYERYLGV